MSRLLGSTATRTRRTAKRLLTAALAFVAVTASAQPTISLTSAPKSYAGFDANEYPGDAALPALHQQFAFTGYWLNDPPGATRNPWAGKRDILVRNGFGFLVVFNGRLDAQIARSKKLGKSPTALGRQDAAVAVAAANREGFPAGAIIFLDQEEGGRMLPEQAEYLLSWTEAVAATDYRPGVYASGQPVNDGKGPDGKPVTITTIQDLREHVAEANLHEIAFWGWQDACPPAPGCVVDPANLPGPDQSGTPDLAAWQYAQSPRRPANTRACAATYNHDGNCYAPGIPGVELDLSVSASPDPSHGR